MTNLGTLKEITDLRSIWPHEALNFTPSKSRGCLYPASQYHAL